MKVDVKQDSKKEYIYVSHAGASMCHCDIDAMQPVFPVNLDMPSKPHMDLKCGGLITDRKLELFDLLEYKREYTDVG